MQMNRALKLFVNGPIWDFLLVKVFLPNIFKLAEPDYSPEKILELGCGIGTSTRQIAKRFSEARIMATDYDPIQVSIAGKRLRSFKKITVAQADATNLSFADNSFDAVFIFNSFHHLNPYEKAIAEIARVLKTGGLVYIMDEGVKFFNPLFRWIDQPESSFEKSDIIKEAEKNSLGLIKQSGTERLFYLVFEKN